jgi:hypothetical protein
VTLCLTEFLPKFGEASFARSCSLLNPLASVESSRLSNRSKQHRDNQSRSQHVGAEVGQVEKLVYDVFISNEVERVYSLVGR